MSTSVYTGLNPFNFIRKHFLQICLCLSAQRLSDCISKLLCCESYLLRSVWAASSDVGRTGKRNQNEESNNRSKQIAEIITQMYPEQCSESLSFQYLVGLIVNSLEWSKEEYLQWR